MLFERVESEGLAHYSYIIGDRNEAVVIDPRRDCEVYPKMASKEGMRISKVLETHRNEDYVIGSVELSSRTGAEIWHADGQLDYKYGQAVEDGMVVKVGRFKLEAISTPGHTPGSMSYLLRDAGGNPWMVFTGDEIFDPLIGAVIGSVAAGNPITSYIVGGELIDQGVSLLAVTAFIAAWVTVGLAQLPAEGMILGKRFALTRNGVSFLSAVIVAILTSITLELIWP